MQLPQGLTTIESQVFSSCTALKQVLIPVGVTAIGDNAFALSGLTSMTLPVSVTSIGDAAFFNCSELTMV